MNYYHLIDQHRMIWEGSKTLIEPEWTLTKRIMRDRGFTPQVVSTTSWPSFWERNKILSADGLSCSWPGATLPHEVALLRRAELRIWASDTLRIGTIMRGIRDHYQRRLQTADLGLETPTRLALLQALVLTTLAVAESDDLITNDTVWGHMESTSRVTPKWWFDSINGSAWAGVWTHINGFTRWYYVGENDDGTLNGNPVHFTLITAAQLEAGKREAEDFVFSLE